MVLCCFISFKFIVCERDKFDCDVEELRVIFVVENCFYYVCWIMLRGFFFLGIDYFGLNGVDGRFFVNGGWNELFDNEGDSEMEGVYDLSYFRFNLFKYDL